jgi:Domain of unknown function (DUF4112)
MGQVTRMPHGYERQRTNALAEVEAIAWVLDNSIPVPGTGGRRFGMDAIIGLVPIAGDLVSGVIGLYLIWRGSRLGVPKIVLARMLTNTALDLAIGAIPFAGDAFDFWFKANTRNLNLMKKRLTDPRASTRDDWLVVGGLALAVVGTIVLIGWFIAQLVGAALGAFS